MWAHPCRPSRMGTCEASMAHQTLVTTGGISCPSLLPFTASRSSRPSCSGAELRPAERTPPPCLRVFTAFGLATSVGKITSGQTPNSQRTTTIRMRGQNSSIILRWTDVDILYLGESGGNVDVRIAAVIALNLGNETSSPPCLADIAPIVSALRFVMGDVYLRRVD